MLSVNQISKTYGDHEVLREVSFLVSPGERVGLIGPNGCGKTTLLHIITGEEKPDSGQVQVAPSVRVGYLAQGLNASPEMPWQTCLDQVLGDAIRAEAEVARLALALAVAPDDPGIQQEYDAALALLQTQSQADAPARLEAVLHNLGLDAGRVPRDLPIAALSGGQKTRLGLALVLLAEPQLLLLDEPTNHLDLDMLAWLEDWLAHFRGAALIVSHDRAFQDQTVTRILELDPRTHTVRQYAGNYADYLDQKRQEVERQWQAYTDQQGEIARLTDAARHLRGRARLRRGGKADDGDKFAKGFFGDQAPRMIRRAKNVERRLERLQNEERVDKPRQTWQMKLAFDGAPASSRDVLQLEDLAVGYDEPLLSDIHLTMRFGERVALIGANGAGKTTLVRTIIGQLPPLAGRVRLGASVRVGYFAQEHDRLNPALNALTTLQQFSHQTETELRHFLHFFLFEGDEVFTPVARLSFGERARLMLATLVARGCNFLVLDEPINHLDIPSRERFEQALAAFEGTALVVAHDRYFISRFATGIWKAEAGEVRVFDDLEGALKLVKRDA
jgi:ATP-binding cassette subfamily F protein 3